MAATRSVVDEWLTAAKSGRAFEVSGEWGSIEGVVVEAQSPLRRGIFARAADQGVRIVALIAPQAPELEHAVEAAHLEDAIAAGLLRSGVYVARVREMRLTQTAEEQPQAWIDAIVDALHAAVAVVPGARPALAGVWLSGSSCALAVSRRDDLAFILLAAAPVPEVMSRRTSENEDDPAWRSSPSLRLVDALSDLSPLQAITMQSRPVLLLQGSCDDALPMAHLEAWRAALAATGRSADGVEIAFTESFFRMITQTGELNRNSEEGHLMVAAVVDDWTRRVVTSAVARPAR